MSDIAKWGLLVAGAIVVVGLIFSLPIVMGLDPGILEGGITALIAFCSDGFRFGRGLINNFFFDGVRPLITALMVWLLAKWVYLITIKIFTWVYHFIFK